LSPEVISIQINWYELRDSASSTSWRIVPPPPVGGFGDTRTALAEALDPRFSAGGVPQSLVTSYFACYSGNKDTYTRYSHLSTRCAQFPSDGSKAIRWVAEIFLPVQLSPGGCVTTPVGVLNQI